MKEQFVTLEIAVKLKEKGFDKKCLAYYNTDPEFATPPFNLTKPFGHVWCLPAPLWQQVIDWFREEHNIDILIEYGGVPKMYSVFVKNWIYADQKDIALFPYYEAREQAILKAIELI
mgnify:CR=1 FL=1